MGLVSHHIMTTQEVYKNIKEFITELEGNACLGFKLVLRCDKGLFSAKFYKDMADGTVHTEELNGEEYWKLYTKLSILIDIPPATKKLVLICKAGYVAELIYYTFIQESTHEYTRNSNSLVSDKDFQTFRELVDPNKGITIKPVIDIDDDADMDQLFKHLNDKLDVNSPISPKTMSDVGQLCVKASQQVTQETRALFERELKMFPPSLCIPVVPSIDYNYIVKRLQPLTEDVYLIKSDISKETWIQFSQAWNKEIQNLDKPKIMILAPEDLEIEAAKEFDFSIALLLLKKGYKVQRKDWDFYIYIVDGMLVSSWDHYEFRPYVEDVLANDYIVVI